MQRLICLTALIVGVMLLAAPAAWTCGELGAMAPRCPMTEMAESMGTSPCHSSDRMSKDCCDMRSDPEPIGVLSIEGVKLLRTLHAIDPQVVEPAPAALPSLSTHADAFRLHDLGRYTLFSSFLL